MFRGLCSGLQFLNQEQASKQASKQTNKNPEIAFNPVLRVDLQEELGLSFYATILKAK